MCHLVKSGNSDKFISSAAFCNQLYRVSSVVICNKRYFPHAVKAAWVQGWTGNDGEAQRVSSSAAPGEKNGKRE